MTDRAKSRRLSPAMEQLLSHAPDVLRPIPREILVSNLMAGVWKIPRFKTFWALAERGKIVLMLRGRPRARWHWRKKV